MSELGLLAQDVIDNDLPYVTGTERTTSISRASGWMSNNIGQLNNLIYTNFDQASDPGLKYEEAVIYKTLYLQQYWKMKAGSVLRNMDSSTLEFLTLREGDSQIQLQNKNEVAKTYMQMAKDAQSTLGNLVWTYNMYQAYPRDVEVIYASATGTTIIESEYGFLATGTVDVLQGETSVWVPFILTNTPKIVNVNLVKPSETSDFMNFSVVGTSITNTGVLVNLGAAPTEDGYQITFGVR